MMTACSLCPRRCNIDRTEKTGCCKSGSEIRIARAAPHMWEEPPISGEKGSGAVFFTGCSMHCVYCQNKEISDLKHAGKAVTPRELSGIFFDLIEMGVHNINLVTPTHFALLIKEALLIKKLSVPVVYNTSGYEKVETLRELRGLVDIYLPDFKYAESGLAKDLSNAPDYPEIAVSAIKEMVAQVGPPQYDERGMMTRGVLIRHLILPGHVQNTVKALEVIKREFSEIPVSLMAQYTPPEDFPEGERFPELTRGITARELKKAEDKLFELDLDGFVQDRASGKPKYIPDFHQY